MAVPSTYADWLNDNSDSEHTGWHTDSIYDYGLRLLFAVIEYRILKVPIPCMRYAIMNNSDVTFKYRNIFDPFSFVTRNGGGSGFCVEGFYKRDRIVSQSSGSTYNARLYLGYPKAGYARNPKIK
jgi:hypothetical protein